MSRLESGFILAVRDALTTLYDDTATFVQKYDSRPSAGSQADVEAMSIFPHEPIVNAWSLGLQLIEAGGEHVPGFVDAIIEPVLPIVAWTCVRSMLEPCALAAWLLDPGIDIRTRMGRTFALRYEGIEQQIKYARASGKMAALGILAARLDKIEQDALAAGSARVVDARGRRVGAGVRMPSATEVIEAMLNDGLAYRMLSAVAHGHSWAILQLSYGPPETEDAGLGGVATKAFKKRMTPAGIGFLGLRVLLAFAHPVWKASQYFGWDQNRLEELLENAADKMQMTVPPRFWRS